MRLPGQTHSNQAAPRAGAARWASPTLWSLAALALFSAFVFSSTNGNLGIWGDDVLILAETGDLHRDYLHIVTSRGFLTPFYTFLYHLAGGSVTVDHWFSFALYIASAFAGFWLIRRWLGNLPALLAAMFYLGYPAKHEIVTWLSAAGYLVVTLVFLASVWIATSRRFSLWTKGAAIALLNWAAAHLVEILFVAAPLYPLLEIFHRKLARRKVFTPNLLATCFPLFGFAAHAAVIYFGTKMLSPSARVIWDRAPNFPHDLTGIALWTLRAWIVGFGAAFGRNYLGLMKVGLTGFVGFVPWTPLLLGCAVGAVVCLVAVYRTDAGARMAAPVRQVMTRPKWLCLAAGGYLALFSHLVGLTIISSVAWSRLLTMTGVGLAIVFGVAADVFLRQRGKARMLPLLMILGVFAQGAAMNSFLYEHQTKWAFDSSIVNSIIGSRVPFHPDDAVFVSFPRTRMLNQYWHVGFSQMEHASLGLIFAAHYEKGAGPRAGELLNRYKYLHDERKYGRRRVNWDIAGALRAATGNLYPYYVRQGDLRVFAIRRLFVRTLEGERIKDYEFFQQAPIPESMFRDVEAVPLFIDNRVVDTPRRAVLCAWRGDLNLQLDGVNLMDDVPLQAEIWQGETKLAARAAKPREAFRLSLPLSRVSPDQPLTLRADGENGRSAAWQVTGVELSKK